MMKLSTMQAVVSTVDDQWESPLADEILRHWEHDADRAKYWRASANFIFYFKKAGQDYILRFNRADERMADLIQAEIDYVNTLAGQDIRVAKPVRSLAGNDVESVATSYGLFHAVVFEALPGDQLDLKESSPAQIEQWGKTLGQLHNAAVQTAISGRPSWQTHLAMVADTLPAGEKAALQTLEVLNSQLYQLDRNDNNFGLIHFDFELDNIIWDGEQAGIIDFDDSAEYWLVADIAFALRDLFGDRANGVDTQNDSYLNFIKGYRRVRPLDEATLQMVPLFLRLHNLITFARLYRAMTPVNPGGELPWMAELRDKLTAKMQFYRDEFATPFSII